MSDFSIYEKMRCADREARLRRINRMKGMDAGRPPRMDEDKWQEQLKKIEYQIKIMQEIADEYRGKWDGVIPSLDVDERFMV